MMHTAGMSAKFSSLVGSSPRIWEAMFSAATWAMVSAGNPVFGTPTAFALVHGAFTAIRGGNSAQPGMFATRGRSPDRTMFIESTACFRPLDRTLPRLLLASVLADAEDRLVGLRLFEPVGEHVLVI